MNRPRVICHMLQSIDGKVTGAFLSSPCCESAIDIYYQLNRAYKAEAYACGRVTMEGSFTGGFVPDLSPYEPISLNADFVVDDLHGFYAVAFDPHGKLGWTTPVIVDDDPGYGGAQIIEVLTKAVDPRHLAYLQQIGISYIIAGDTQPNMALALEKLQTLFGIETLLLEGGSILDGAFLREGLVDELSLVIVPVIAEGDDKPLFNGAVRCEFALAEMKTFECGTVWLQYTRTEESYYEKTFRCESDALSDACVDCGIV